MEILLYCFKDYTGRYPGNLKKGNIYKFSNHTVYDEDGLNLGFGETYKGWSNSNPDRASCLRLLSDEAIIQIL